MRVELHEGVCYFCLQVHGGPGHRVSKLEAEVEHSGVPGVQCLLQLVGEARCPGCEMEVPFGVGG